MDIFDLPLSFALPLVVHAFAGLAAVIIGMAAGCLSKQGRQHPRWGRWYIWAYTGVFLTAILLTFQIWFTHGYLFFIGLVGYGCALGGFVARRFRAARWMPLALRRQWLVAHLSGMMGSYMILWIGFLVDNAPKVPGLSHLPPLIFWLLPPGVGLPFLIRSMMRVISRKFMQKEDTNGLRKEKGSSVLPHWSDNDTPQREA